MSDRRRGSRSRDRRRSRSRSRDRRKRSRDRAGILRRSDSPKGRGRRRSKSRERKASTSRDRDREKEESDKAKDAKKAEVAEEEGKKRKKGWDNDADKSASSTALAPAAAPSPTIRIQSFQEILAQVKAGVLPVGMPAVPGSAYGLTLPARPLYESGWRGPSFGARSEECPQASPEALEAARQQAKKAEEAGREACRAAGGIAPKGPPGLPCGVYVVEQKFIDFLVGPGGQSLAAINHAAGVNVMLDQSPKYFGYSFANIYGPEVQAERAKLAIQFKVSQWLPRGGTYGPGSGVQAAPASLRPPAPPAQGGGARIPPPADLTPSAQRSQLKDGHVPYDPLAAPLPTAGRL